MTGDPLSILVQPDRESKRIIDQFVVLISTTQQAHESLSVKPSHCFETCTQRKRAQIAALATWNSHKQIKKTGRER